MANKLNQDLTPVNPVASGILVVNPLIFFRRSPYVFPASFPIPLANLLANFGDIPLYRLNPGPMLKLDLGPSFGCNSIDPIIVNLVGSESPLKLFGTESPLEMAGTESPLEMVWTESSLEIVRTKSLLEMARTESPLEMVGTESPLEMTRTESLLSGAGQEMPWVLQAIDA
ncbi:hypothetical protein GW17_00058732 [Ensete ventricosum]|nr:hypothetical protein GW17_00058732 [Ensete ventricosum]